MEMFSFKKIIVWQKSLDYAIRVSDFTDEVRKKGKYYRMLNQLDDSSFSVKSNIAEGNGRYSKKDNSRFLFIARGSLYESVSQLNYFNRKGYLSNLELESFEKDAQEAARLLSGLINSYKE
jgi:four helix bundle protein